MNSTIFSLKTNRFVGSSTSQPDEQILLSQFDALNNSFYPDINLFSSNKLQNLQGRELIAGAFDYRPFVAVDFKRSPRYYDHAEDNPSHSVHVDGVDMRIVHTFCEIYNCSVQFDTSEKEEWGTALANYSGYGLIGMIIDGKIHLAMGGMYMWYVDYAAIDITTFIGRSEVICLVPAPTSLVDWILFIRPFQLTLWLAVCACLLLETISLLIARRFEHTLKNDTNSWWSCTKFGYITSLKLFISQSSSYPVNSHTVRTVLFACYMIDIIITSIYGGGLSATLTVPHLEEVADSLERFYSHKIRWTGSSYVWVQSLEDDPNSDAMFKSILDHFEINTMDEMHEKSLTENMGFVLERLIFGHFANGDFITPQALDRLKLMIEPLYSQYCVIMVPRMWPHLSKFNDFILAWHSSGFGKFWEWKIAADYLNINQQNRMQASRFISSSMGPSELDMKNFAGLIAILFVGTMISIVTFVGELLWYQVERMNRERLRLKNLNNFKRKRF